MELLGISHAIPSFENTTPSTKVHERLCRPSLGYDTVSDSPFGIGAPSGMDPALTQRLHDAFKKTLDDPAVLATFEKYDQSVIYMNTADYTKFARDNFAKEKAVIERLGLAAKPS